MVRDQQNGIKCYKSIISKRKCCQNKIITGVGYDGGSVTVRKKCSHNSQHKKESIVDQFI